MKKVESRELVIIALAQFLLVGLFFLSLRVRLGPLYETVLIEPSGLLQQRPWMDFNGRQLFQGQFPLWNPYTGFGQPHLANLQTAVFYPLNFIVYFLGANLGFELWLFLRLWLGAFFLYFFMRELKLLPIPSLGGSLVWPLGGYGLWFMQLVDLNSQILLPVFLLFFHRLAERARLRIFICIIVIGFLIILGGHPEPIFNSWIIGSGYFLFIIWRQNFSCKEKLSRFVLLIFIGALSILASSIVLLPFINYAFRCWSLHYPGFGFFHLDISTIFSLILPGVNWNNRGTGKILVELLPGGIFEVFKAGYRKTICPGMMPGVGIIGMALIFFGILKLKKVSPVFSFFSCLMIFLLGLTYGISPFNWLAFLPWFSTASNYKFYYSEIHFCFSLLTSLGLSKIKQVSKWAFFIVFILLIVSLYCLSFTVKPYLELGLKNLDQQEWLKEIKKDPDSKFYRLAIISEKPALLPNLAMMVLLKDIASSDALFPESYVKIMLDLNGIKPEHLLNYFYPAYYFRLTPSSLTQENLSKISQAGIKWLIGDNLSSHIRDIPRITIKKYGRWEVAILEDAQVKSEEKFFSRLKTITKQDFRIGLRITEASLLILLILGLLRKRNDAKA